MPYVFVFEQYKATAVHYFSVSSRLKTSAVFYFSVFNSIKPKKYLLSAFSIEENTSHTLFLLFEQYKTSPVP